MTTEADPKQISVLSYAQGFTLWHYKLNQGELAQIELPGFFNQFTTMFAPGDILFASGPEGASIRLIVRTDQPVLTASFGG